MSGPWERYAAQPAEAGPWTKYAAPPPAAPEAAPIPDENLTGEQRLNKLSFGMPDLPPPEPQATARNSETIPSGFAAVGGLAGSVLGAAGGPAGMVAGGTLGAAGGRYAGELANKAFGIGVPKDTMDMLKSAGTEAYWQALLGAGFPIAALAKEAALATALGMSHQQFMQARQMAAAGLAPGIADISKGVFPQTYENVIGRFPIAGAPFRQEFSGYEGKPLRGTEPGKVAAVNQQARNQVESVGTPRPVTEIGEEMVDRGTATYNAFRDKAKTLYDDARASATMADLPTTNLRKAAKDIVDEWDAGTAFRNTPEGGQAPITRVEPDIVKKAREVADITDRIGFKQYEALADDMDRLYRLAKQEGHNFKRATEFDRAAQQDLAGLSDQEAYRKFKEADAFFAENRKRFETPVAKKFGTVQKRIFGFGFEEAGTRNPDELMALAFTKRSPMAMAQLHDLVGKQTFSDALASNLDDVFSQSLKTTIVNGQPAKVLDADAVRKSLGLDRERGPAYQALATAYRLAGKEGGAEQLVKFLEAVEATTARGAPNLSQFLARRAALGGQNAVEGGFPMFRAFSQGSVGPLLSALGARRMSYILASPERLRDMTILLDPQSRAEALEGAYTRILRAIPVASAVSAGGDREVKKAVGQ